MPDSQNERVVLWFQVDDVDEEYRRLLDRKVQILEPPVDSPWRARYMVFCDPDGNRVRFITPKEQRSAGRPARGAVYLVSEFVSVRLYPG